MLIQGKQITLNNLYAASHNTETKFSVSEESLNKIKTSRNYIENRLSQGDTIYGVNTGFGAFANVKISDSEIELLQKNLIRSHSSGIGEPFTLTETRAMMILRANTLATGYSGVRVEVIHKILEYLNHNIIPVIPSQGSVGASGDLAPLSHLALALIGEGYCWGKYPEKIKTKDLLIEKNIQALELKAKEGLSLINGCQVMTAIGMLSAWESQRLLELADLAGAMSLEALKGSRTAFDPLISAVRPHPGEIRTAAHLTKILGKNSEIGESHLQCSKVQDAYSLRCMPTVHGAVWDTLQFAIKILETEANASTDNPLVFAQENKILSCGNFHGMPVAFAMDYLGIAFSSLASMSQCRISQMIHPAMSGLPAFLTPNGGLNSGHMIVQVAAASLVSENKVLAHPASVDTIPTSADKEDHVSMGTIAARKFRQILNNAEHVIAMEFLSASQGIDLLSPLKPSGDILKAHQILRKHVPFATEDRIFSEDIEKIRNLIKSNAFNEITQP
ncbi:MAG TPA: histidine ammonia-lyase [Pseudobdellovibrionaceae bacterium]|nr:histidine ammonia-lyase [Pseudobdellovibrionaceae bacterium]